MEYRMHSPVDDFEIKDVIDNYQKKRADKGED
jgi:hypothetical protein